MYIQGITTIMTFTRLAGIIGILILASACRGKTNEASSVASHMAKKPPNFIVIYTDDQRFNGIGINSNTIIKTPNIDRMARQAMQFTNANVAFSLCSPSRAALLTGRYGSSNGVLNLGSALKKGEKSIADYLRANGYGTALSGKWHIKQQPAGLGFEFYSYFRSNGTYYGREVINMYDTVYPKMHVDKYGVLKSIEFLEDQKDSDKPFFLFYCPQTPHMNGELVWDAKDSTKQTYDRRKMPVPENRLDDLKSKPPYLKTVRNLVQAKKYGYPDSLDIQNHVLDYYSVISELDGFLGMLFDKIDESGLRDNTYVLFMSDNGWMLGDHGFTSKVLPYRPSSHVPFWVLGPDIEPGINNSLVSNLDIFPTLMQLADATIPGNIHGQSLAAVLKGEREKVRDYFVYEGLGSYGESKPNLTVIAEDFRYIKTYEDSTLAKVGFIELYDQHADALEVKNLANENQYLALIEKMDNQLEGFKEEILDGTKYGE